MVSNPAVGSTSSIASLSTESIEVLRDYLDQAPEELSGWVREQRACVDVLLEQRSSESGSSGPVVSGLDSSGSTTTSAPVTAALPTVLPSELQDQEEDESEDFYNDMEGEDDILQLKRTPGSQRARAAAKPGRQARGKRAPAKIAAASTASAAGEKSALAGASGDSGGASRAARKGFSNLSLGARIALVAILIAGVIGGVKLAGQGSSDNTAVGSAPSIGTEQVSGDVAARMAELTAAIEKNPNAVEERLELGVLYFNDRHIAQAQELWLKVAELAPDNVSVWYNLGFSYLSMDPAQMDAAKGAWQRVVELDPDSQMALTVSMHLQGLDMSGAEEAPGDSEEEPTVSEQEPTG